MLIPVEWLKDFTDVSDVPPDDLAETFTLKIAEVEEVRARKPPPGDVRVARVLASRPHPNADSLRLVSFDLGGGERGEVVCGAANVRVGMGTAHAPVGARLPDGRVLEAREIRGVVSRGMLCSERELGLGSDAEGIMDLGQVPDPGAEPSSPVGRPLAERLGGEAGAVLHVDNKSLTHRPDLWGLLGVARECAVAFGRTFTDPFDERWAQGLEALLGDGDGPVAVSVDPNSSCLRYLGLSIDGARVGPSPDWLRGRLAAAGIRSVNNVVDVGNYVMVELGMPLHIFDRDGIKGGALTVARAGREAVLRTLDGEERGIVPEDTVISDAEGPLVLAGIMGGKGSGVADATERIFIEAANWKASEVRRTSARLGLRTDAAARFEKSLDGSRCRTALLRALELVRRTCPGAAPAGGVARGGPEAGGAGASSAPRTVRTSPSSISRALGRDVPAAQVRGVLEGLGFGVREAAGPDAGGDAGGDAPLDVEVPSFRAGRDVETEADVVEEVGRMAGYDGIEPAAPLRKSSPARPSPFQALERRIRTFLSLHGEAHEVMTYPFVGASLLDRTLMRGGGGGDVGDGLLLANALSRDADRMRASLVPGILRALALNAKNFPEFRLFELGRTYKPHPRDFASEGHELAVLAHSAGDRGRPGDGGGVFMDLVNLAERLFAYAGLPAQLAGRHPKTNHRLIADGWPGIHPFERWNVRLMGRMDGAVFSVHPSMLRRLKVKGRAAMLVLDLSFVEGKTIKPKRTAYKPPPKFPASRFDYCLTLPRDLPVQDVLDRLKALKMREAQAHRVVDVHRPDGAGVKHVTFRTTFRDESGTLSGDALKGAQEKVLATLAQAGWGLKGEGEAS